MSALIGVLTGHRLDSRNANEQVFVGGVRHNIWGHSTGVLESRILVVVLLSDDSTPHDHKIHPDAERSFQAAAKLLVIEGKEFYTVMRPTWALRAMHWTKECR